MNFNTRGGINLRVMGNDRLYECGDSIPAICPICKKQIDDQKYIINHSISTYRCLGCSRLFVLYKDWLFMPNRDFYKVDHDMNAVRNRQEKEAEKRINEKIEQAEKHLNRSRCKLDGIYRKKQEDEIKDEKKMKEAVKIRNGKPLGNMPKQRKRSIFS